MHNNVNRLTTELHMEAGVSVLCGVSHIPGTQGELRSRAVRFCHGLMSGSDWGVSTQPW